MKKNYIAPSMKVRELFGDKLMNGGLQETSNGGYSQTVNPSNPGETVDGGEALGKYNAWGIWDSEDLQEEDK